MEPEEGGVMAKTTKERSAKAAKKREQYDERELRHKVRIGTRNMLEDLMAWTEDSEQASVMGGCIRHLHSLGREGAIEALKTRHKFEVTETWRDRFDNESRRVAGTHSDDCEHEVVEPCI